MLNKPDDLFMKISDAAIKHSASKTQNKITFLQILLVALFVGTLDILTAFVDYFLATGNGPEGVLRFIASGVFGRDAFTGGSNMIFAGLLFHFLIAYSFTVLFCFIYPKIKLLQKNKLITAILYGMFIWIVMNLIVVPLSNTPPREFTLVKIIKSMMILIVMIGLPLSFFGDEYIGKHEKEKAF